MKFDGQLRGTFDGPANVTKIGPRQWRLNAMLCYRDMSGFYHCAPRDFISDGGSIPRLFWRIASPMTGPVRAYIIHDWLCAQARIFKSYKKRKLADELFSEMLRVLGVPTWKRVVLRKGVDIGRLAAKARGHIE